MGKTVLATDMLRVGRRDRTGADQSQQLDDSATSDLGNKSSEELSDLLPSNSVTAPSSVTESQQHSDQLTSRLVAGSATYQRATVFLTPDQRRWLKDTSRALPVEGLSASDVVRLAVTRLRQDVESGLPLVDVLTAQAHKEAETMSGRRNRGLPPHTG